MQSDQCWRHHSAGTVEQHHHLVITIDAAGVVVVLVSLCQCSAVSWQVLWRNVRMLPRWGTDLAEWRQLMILLRILDYRRWSLHVLQGTSGVKEKRTMLSKWCRMWKRKEDKWERQWRSNSFFFQNMSSRMSKKWRNPPCSSSCSLAAPGGSAAGTLVITYIEVVLLLFLWRPDYNWQNATHLDGPRGTLPGWDCSICSSVVSGQDSGWALK